MIDVDAKNKKSQDSGDIELPNWVGQVARWLYLGIGLVLLASSLALLGCSSAGATNDALAWQSATEVVSKARAERFASENSSGLSEEELSSLIDSMQIAQLGEMRVVDFNSPLLTGRLGTLHAIYNSAGDRIFNRYLNSQLPKSVPTLQASNRAADGSCLVVNDIDPSSTEANINVLQTTLCYDGAEWIKENAESVSVSEFQ